jgi:CRISPR system Cascade subunit CasA
MFNLMDQPCVPVGRGRSIDDVSLREALLASHEIDGLALEHAVQEPPLLRLLVAIVLRAFGPPRDARDLTGRWRERRFPEAPLEAYLNSVAGAFDLFSPDHPFAQVANLHTSNDETKASSLLIPAIPSGNNVPLFAGRTEGDPVPLTPAEAFRWLLSTHAWDTAAIKSGAVGDPAVKSGKTTGNPTGPLGQLGVVIPIGSTLFETILLNLPWRADGTDPNDIPHWEKKVPASPAWERRQPLGVVELLTWQSRRIRLVPTQREDGSVVVEQVVVAGGDRLVNTPEYEPHTAWNIVKVAKPGDPPMRPRRHQSGQAAWRGLPALLALKPDARSKTQTSTLLTQLAVLEGGTVLTDDYPLLLRTVGVEYGNMFAVVENVIADQLPLPVAALRADLGLRDLLEQIASQAKALHDAANFLHGDLRRAAGGDPVPWDKSQRPGELVLHALNGVVRRILTGFQTSDVNKVLIESATVAWQQAARRTTLDTVEPLLRAAPPETFLGRPISPELRVTAGTAESAFRRRLAETLPRARAPRTSPPTTQEEVA